MEGGREARWIPPDRVAPLWWGERGREALGPRVAWRRVRGIPCSCHFQPCQFIMPVFLLGGLEWTTAWCRGKREGAGAVRKLAGSRVERGGYEEAQGSVVGMDAFLRATKAPVLVLVTDRRWSDGFPPSSFLELSRWDR